MHIESILLLCLLAAGPSDEVRVQPNTLFLRANDLAGLNRQTWSADVGAETGRRFSSDGREFRDKINYRLRFGYALTQRVRIRVEQTAKFHPDANEWGLGAFSPEIRYRLSRWERPNRSIEAVETSVYLQPRIRIEGRRDPSVVMGAGALLDRGDLLVVANLGAESAQPQWGNGLKRELGVRYDVGASLGWGRVLRGAVESWGHASWDSSGNYIEQEHFLGPSVSYRLEAFRLTWLAFAGARDRPFQKRVVSLNGALQLSMGY